MLSNNAVSLVLWWYSSLSVISVKRSDFDRIWTEFGAIDVNSFIAVDIALSSRCDAIVRSNMSNDKS